MSEPGCHVSRCGSPPRAATTYTSVLPAYCPLNATCAPSGDSCGFDASPAKLVSRRASPPARSTIQMLPAYANAMCVALIVGVRSRRVLPFGSSRPARATGDAAPDCDWAGEPDAVATTSRHASAGPAQDARREGGNMESWGWRPFEHARRRRDLPARLALEPLAMRQAVGHTGGVPSTGR